MLVLKKGEDGWQVNFMMIIKIHVKPSSGVESCRGRHNYIRNKAVSKETTTKNAEMSTAATLDTQRSPVVCASETTSAVWAFKGVAPSKYP
jgi:hypothetical protein